MSLREMTEAAEEIFQGKVTKFSNEQIEIQGSKGKVAKVRVNVVTFDVTRRLKGNVVVGSPFEVRQVSTATVPVEVGDELLWYLAKPGKTGFTAPLGVYSGHFKVLADPQSPQAKMVVNLVDNEGLWSTTTSLVEPNSKLSQQQLIRSLDKAELTPGRAAYILSLAGKPNRPGPLPLDLITSATESLLATQP